MEIARNIHLIPKIRGANTYVILEETQAGNNDHLTLIDTGMPGNADRIIEYLKSLGKEQMGSFTIVLTHPDIDHSGSVADLKEKLGKVKVAIHEADAPRLTGEKPLKEARGLVGFLFKAMSPFMKFKPVPPDFLLKDGELVDGLRVIHTPGHTQGSMCLYSERLKAMFVGDALRTDKHRMPQPPSAAMSVNIEEAKNSIGKIASYEFELLLPGHGTPILTDASGKVKKLNSSLA
jgi:hydroxyacylglutathione hydrolase